MFHLCDIHVRLQAGSPTSLHQDCEEGTQGLSPLPGHLPSYVTPWTAHPLGSLPSGLSKHAHPSNQMSSVSSNKVQS